MGNFIDGSRLGLVSYFPLLIMNKKETKSPAKRFKLRGNSASVFENTTKDGQSRFGASLQRSYKDGEEFKSTNFFYENDLPLVIVLAFKAWLEILDLKDQKKKD